MAERESYIELGGRYRTPQLTAQAEFFAGLAEEDTEDLSRFGWTSGKTDELRSLREEVSQAFRSRTLAAEDVSAATEKRDAILSDAKAWMRQLVTLAPNAFFAQPEEADDFAKARKLSRRVAYAIERIGYLVDTAKKHKAALSEWGINASFLKEGEALLKALRESEGKQDRQVADLPREVQNFREKKGRLYVALKRLQRVGRATYVRDPLSAARYNLNILYSKPGARAASRVRAAATTGSTVS